MAALGNNSVEIVDVTARRDARLAQIARVKTDAGARTALFAPDERRLFLAVPHRGAQKAAIKVFEVR